MNGFAIQPILDELERIESTLNGLRRRLAAMTQSQGEDNQPTSNKREDGRLTDVGIAAIHAAFDAGATVMQISRQFEITPSAASNRRKIWQSSTAKRS